MLGPAHPDPRSGDSMARYCELCRQAYSDDLERCPRCQARDEPAATAAQPSWTTTALSSDADAHIDLGSPVTDNAGPNGPPSGGSFISWTALLRRRIKGGPASSAPGRAPRFTIPPAAPAAPTPARDARLAHLFAGFLLGCAGCLGLWLVGAEPPLAWRHAVQQWLANDSGGRPQPARNPSSAE
jgi:hypothetical protein